MLDLLAYIPVRALVALLQALPVNWVARIGRCGGALFWHVDGRHRRVALQNLSAAFGSEKTSEETRALARENFKRIGEAYACGIKTSAMTREQLAPHLEITGIDKLRRYGRDGKRPSVMVAVGHFGNFEIYARTVKDLEGYRAATTYRGIKQRRLNALLLSLRKRSGCLNFERRTEGRLLRKAIAEGGLVVGLLSDQHAGRSGVRLPFFGRECSAQSAPAVFALRYRIPLHTAICYRLAPGKWRIEMGDEIPTLRNGSARSVEDIVADINRALEEAVRRDPANWFWVHNRWKKVPALPPENPSAASGAREAGQGKGS